MKIRTTLGAFQVATYVGNNPKHRGSKIKRIDDVLRTYWENFDQLPLRNQIALTAALFVECKNWLKSKAGKSDTKKTLFGQKENTTLKRRREAILALAEECLTALDALEAEVDPNNRLLRRVDRKKVRALGSGLNRPGSKTLETGYHFERSMWVNSGKTQSWGGSGVHAKVHGNELTKDWGKTQRKRSVEELSFDEYQRIGELCNTGTVQYLKKQERLVDLVEIDEEGLLRNASSHELLHPEHLAESVPTTMVEMATRELSRPISNLSVYMYAMDSYGNLFARWISVGKDEMGGHNFFNHSSLVSGREVTCAGRLCAVNGRLILVDNISGHYKPRRANVENCVRMLQADGVDLSETVAEIAGFGGSMQLFSVERLLQEGSQPDLGVRVGMRG